MAPPESIKAFLLSERWQNSFQLYSNIGTLQQDQSWLHPLSRRPSFSAQKCPPTTSIESPRFYLFLLLVLPYFFQRARLGHMLAVVSAVLVCLFGVVQLAGAAVTESATPLGFATLLAWRIYDALITPANGYWFTFLGFFLIRYVRLIVHMIASWTYQPIIPGPNPVFSGRDCTVIMATVDGNNPVFMKSIESILANEVFHIYIVVPFQNAGRLAAVFASNPLVTVLGSQRASKRFQQVCGLRCVNTPVTIFVDDDVIWGPRFLWVTLAALNDRRCGAVGTCQRLFRDAAYNVWDFLGALYLERRNFECSATANISGYLSTLSGRCQIIRTDIVRNDEFMHGYLSEKWLNRVILTNADDDKFVTRWVKRHGWKMFFQYCPEASMETLHSSDSRFLGQCVRWYRTIWRGAITSMFVERTMWKGQPWSCYANLSRVFIPPALITDTTLAYLLYKSCAPDQVAPRMLLFGLWVLFTKTIKFVPHFWRYSSDLKYLPVQLAFAYFHGFIKLYALFTVHKTNWSGRLAAEELGDVALSMAWPVGGTPDDVVTPGVERLVGEGQGILELPRSEKKPVGPQRPRLAKRPTYRGSLPT